MGRTAMQARRAAILGAIAFATIGIVTVAIRLDDPPAGPAGERASVPRRVEGSEPSLSFEGGSSESPGSERAAEVRSDSPELPPVASGILRLEFVSALDGRPVPDLPFVVHRERGGNKVLASGASDAQGRAEVRDLEENVILVETVRRPPFASRVEACWLSRAETKDLVVRLDGGGRVIGRVVDEAQRPVEGAEILAAADPTRSDPPNPLDRGGPAAVTGPDGRFAVDQVATKPQGVWIVDGEARPERWQPAQLHVRKDVSVEQVAADVRPGETLDVGDVLLERCPVLAGIVLDAERRPLPGALVSGRYERRSPRRSGEDPWGFKIPPGREGFRLRASETLTDANGRFELLASPRDSHLAVWAPWGQRQVFTVPAPPPGERRDELVLELRAVTLLEIELRDVRGERVTGPGPAARGGAFQTRTLNKRRAWGPRAVVVVRLDDGGSEQVTTDADPDGVFRYEFETRPARMRELTLDLSGYETVRDRIEGRVDASTRLAYVLEEIPGLRFRVLPRTGESPGSETANLWLQICLAPPQRRLESPGWWCCGLGSILSFDWNGEPREFVFPADAPREYWTYLRSQVEGQGLVDLASFGPFAPGPELHEIEIDPALLERIDRAKPPEEKPPGERPEPASLSLRVLDARTREPIAGASVAALGRNWFPQLATARDGRVDRAEVPAGDWSLVAWASTHRRVEIPDVVLVEGGARDLGTIELEPIPSFPGRILRADGSPAGRGCWIRARLADHPTAETDGEGRFRLLADVPERVVLDLIEQASSPGEGDRAVQRTVVEGWTIGVEQEIRLAPWQRVEIRIGGPATELPDTSLMLWACPAPGEPPFACDHRASALPDGHEPLLFGFEVEPIDERRVFRFRTAPGRYQVYGRDLLHEVPVEVIEVRESDDLQVFELSSR